MDLVYTRSDVGSFPVHIQEQSDGHRIYTLERPEGIQVFPSARQLLIQVTGHQEARHWTFERYFRTGKHADPMVTGDTPILDLLGPGGWAVDPVVIRATKVSPTRRPSHVGIDLEKRGHEVAKLLFAGFSGMIRAGGYDPEDVLQEVYKGILIRNAGKCPFDPAKATFGHYVHMVCSCVVTNYHRRLQRHSNLDLVTHDDDDGEDQRFVAPAFDITDTQAQSDLTSTMRPHPQRALARRVLPLLRDGLNRQEMAEVLGENKTNVGRAVRLLRDHSMRVASR